MKSTYDLTAPCWSFSELFTALRDRGNTVDSCVNGDVYVNDECVPVPNGSLGEVVRLIESMSGGCRVPHD